MQKPRKALSGQELKELKKKLESLKEKGTLKKVLETTVREMEKANEYFRRAPVQLKLDLSQKPIGEQLRILQRMKQAADAAPEYVKEVLRDPVKDQLKFWEYLASLEGEELDKALFALEQLEKEKKIKKLKERLKALKKD